MQNESKSFKTTSWKTGKSGHSSIFFSSSLNSSIINQGNMSVFKKMEDSKKIKNITKEKEVLFKGKNDHQFLDLRVAPIEMLKNPQLLNFQPKNIQRRSFLKKSNSGVSKGVNYLWIVFFVKKFIDILKQKTIETKLRKLETYHQTIFDDFCFFKNETQKNKAHLNNPIYNIYVIIN